MWLLCQPLTQISLEVNRQDDAYAQYCDHWHVGQEISLEGEVLQCITPTLLQNVVIAAGEKKFEDKHSIHNSFLDQD